MASKEEKRRAKAEARAEAKAKAKAEIEAASPESSQSPEPTQSPEPPKSSSKRKAETDEIEVDLAAPEPPSKRARRALKKGKQLPQKPSSDDDKDGESKADGKDGKKEKAARSEHAVWIGNLAFHLKPSDLREWLVNNSGGVITEEMITRVKLPTVKEPGRDKDKKPANKGFAYVDFVDISAKVAAIALSENDLGGRKLLIKDATSFEGRPKKEKEPTEDAETDDVDAAKKAKDAANASRKVFIGNMSFKTTEEDVWRNFEKCGEIEWAKVATFEDTGKCKGFGWIKFKEPEAAAWAVKGFVRVKEQVETEDDFKEEAGEDSDGQDEEAKPKKQFKTRKWWVNRMLGRELKLELAEDDQVRYKKRFKQQRPDGDREGGAAGSAPRGNGRDRPDRGGRGSSSRSGGNDRRGEGGALKESSDISVARLTGAVVKPTGTKMTFD